MTARRQRFCAFTLMEVIVALAISGVVTASSVTLYSTYARAVIHAQAAAAWQNEWVLFEEVLERDLRSASSVDMWTIWMDGSYAIDIVTYKPDLISSGTTVQTITYYYNVTNQSITRKRWAGTRSSGTQVASRQFFSTFNITAMTFNNLVATGAGNTLSSYTRRRLFFQLKMQHKYVTTFTTSITRIFASGAPLFSSQRP